MEVVVEAVPVVLDFAGGEAFGLTASRVEVIVVIEAEIDKVVEMDVCGVVVEVGDLLLLLPSTTSNVVAEAASPPAGYEDLILSGDGNFRSAGTSRHRDLPRRERQ